MEYSLLKILQEIGDASTKPFSFPNTFIELSFDIKQNNFKDDDGNNISLTFTPFNIPDSEELGYNVGFKVNGVEDSKGISGKDGKYYFRLMSTLTKIINNFIEKYNREQQE